MAPFQRAEICEGCRVLLVELRDARQSDQDSVRRRLRDLATASGRDIDDIFESWLSSVTTMPDNEFRTLCRGLYHRIAEVQRKIAEHERLTGHSVIWNGLRTACESGHAIGPADYSVLLSTLLLFR